MKSTYQVIKEAREILSNPNAWFKGGLEAGDGRVCAIGAVRKAAFGSPTVEPGDLDFELNGGQRRYYYDYDDRSYQSPNEDLEMQVRKELMSCVPSELDDDSGYPVYISDVEDYNDYGSITHADILRMFDCALTHFKEAEEVVDGGNTYVK